MAKVVFVNRFYFPDHSATSQLLTDLANDLAVGGFEVHVLTSRMRSDQPKDRLGERETIDGVVVHRVLTSRFGRHVLHGRTLDYFTFYLMAFLKLLFLLRAGDTVVAKTDPPLISVVCWIAARIKRARLVNWLQDLFPELAAVLGFQFARGAVGRMLQWLRDQSLHAASVNVVIGETMRDKLLACGIQKDQITLIHNWSDEKAVRPVAHKDNHLRTDWGLEGRFVIAYSGNMGRAHEFETLLEAAALLKDEPSIVFLLIGDGQQRKALEEEVARRRLSNVQFRPYQPRRCLCFSLGVADVHLISLRPELEGLIVPSKFYGVVAAGRATCFIGQANGEIARLLRAHECGVSVPLGHGRELANILKAWALDPSLVIRMGSNARAALESGFTASSAKALWRIQLASAYRMPLDRAAPK